MKILIVGHKPYISWLLQEILNLDFLTAQPIDYICVAQIKRNKVARIKQLKTFFSTLTGFRLHKLRLMVHLSNINVDLSSPYFNFADNIPRHDNLNEIDYDKFFIREFISNYDLMLIASYGGKIPKKVFSSPKLGTWNIHPSVLPQLKGGYPTVVQALDARFLIGTTIHEMTDRIDEGRILGQKYRENKKSQPNHVLFRQSATDAAKMLKDWLDSNMEWETLKTPNVPSSTCKEYFKPDWYIGNYTKGTDIHSLVNAFSMPHMFPFIYGFSGFKLVQILSVSKSTSRAEVSKGIHFRNLETPEKAELVFYSQTYQLLAYILNGKNYQR